MVEPARLDCGCQERAAGVQASPAGGRADIAVWMHRSVLSALIGARIAYNRAQLQGHADHAGIGVELAAQDA